MINILKRKKNQEQNDYNRGYSEGYSHAVSKSKKLIQEQVDLAYLRGKAEGHDDGWLDGFRDGRTRGVEDERDRMIKIVEKMQETAESMMWTEREAACARFLEQIRAGR